MLKFRKNKKVLLSIGAIDFSLPCCARYEESQRSCSLKVRILMVALGVIFCVLGALAISKIPVLEGLGRNGGIAFICGGSLLLIGGAALRCVRGNRPFAAYRAFDREIMGHVGAFESEITGADGQRTKKKEQFSLLDSFLNSSNPEDQALQQKIAAEMGIPTLSGRLKENLPDSLSAVWLRMDYLNDVRDETLLTKVLKLLAMTQAELEHLSLEQIEQFTIEERDMISIRLMDHQASDTWVDHTLGHFLHYRDEVLTCSPAFYPFFSLSQVQFFIEQHDRLSEQIVTALFPYSSATMGFTIHSSRVLNYLPEVNLRKVLFLLDGRLLWTLIRSRESDLDFNLFTQSQVKVLFPTGFRGALESRRLFEGFPVNALNRLLSKMNSSQLRIIPDQLLADANLDLQQVAAGDIKGMFPMGLMAKDESLRKIGLLSPSNQEYVKGILKLR